MEKLQDNWEFNVLGVYNFNKKGKLDIYYDHIASHLHIEGDILEAGVFRGRSLLSTALLLKKLGSKKKVYGFDSFSGFPPIYHKNDDLKNFEELKQIKKITDEHFQCHLKLKKYRSMLKSVEVTVANISSSAEFSETNEEQIKKKADFLELDNIVLIKGNFADTMQFEKMKDLKIMSALLDCDLYSSYRSALPFIYTRLQTGGLMYLDEYYSLKFPGARIACDEFFEDCTESPLKAERIAGEFPRYFIIKQ